MPAQAASGAAEKPNIVYLLADQWRASATGYAGDPNVKTPNLDRLASEGLWFRNAVSVCPVCTPYRAVLMTGRFPTSTGMFLNDAHLPDSELCLAEVLKAAGYATAYIGKWHLDGHGRSAYIPPARRRGWDYWKAAECDHCYNHSHYYTDDSDVMRFWQGYDAAAQTKDAQQYIRDHARDPRPFVLFLSFGPPHFSIPFGIAPEEFKAMYPPEKIKLPPNVPEAMQAPARKKTQDYYAHCTALDRCVGDVLTTLREAGIAGRTIVVFTADHGEMLGSHGCPPKMKQVPWTSPPTCLSCLRDPAIQGGRGRRVNMPLTTPDIFPTLLGLAGVGVPRCVEGEDLSGAIASGREIGDRDALYMGVAPFLPREFAKEIAPSARAAIPTCVASKGRGCCWTTRKIRIRWTIWSPIRNAPALCKDLDGRLQARLKKIGDDFRPGRPALPSGATRSLPTAVFRSTRRTPARRHRGGSPRLPRRVTTPGWAGRHGMASTTAIPGDCDRSKAPLTLQSYLFLRLAVSGLGWLLAERLAPMPDGRSRCKGSSRTSRSHSPYTGLGKMNRIFAEVKSRGDHRRAPLLDGFVVVAGVFLGAHLRRNEYLGKIPQVVAEQQKNVVLGHRAFAAGTLVRRVGLQVQAILDLLDVESQVPQRLGCKRAVLFRSVGNVDYGNPHRLGLLDECLGTGHQGRTVRVVAFVV